MPGRNYVSNNYRFGYQGQFAEKDEETGYNQFEARLWDARVGRWMTIDPARQFYSPYLGMGNDPVNGVDPDGEIFGKGWLQGFLSKHQKLSVFLGRWKSGAQYIPAGEYGKAVWSDWVDIIAKAGSYSQYFNAASLSLEKLE